MCCKHHWCVYLDHICTSIRVPSLNEIRVYAFCRVHNNYGYDNYQLRTHICISGCVSFGKRINVDLELIDDVILD